MAKKFIVPMITFILFIITYYILNMYEYTFTTISVYVFIALLFIEFLIIRLFDKKKTLIIRIIYLISYIFIYGLIMLFLLSTYGYDVRLKYDYVTRKSLLDFKPTKEISKSPNIFVKSKKIEYCSLELCD